MKRLQFRHEDQIFASRTEAYAYLTSLFDSEHVNHASFGESLYAEPMVLRYRDEDDELQLILAIGKKNPSVDGAEIADFDYHIIDTAGISDTLKEHEIRLIDVEQGIEDVRESVENNAASIVRCDHALDENVRDEFVLKNANGDILGEHIKIYKDSALVDAQLGGSGVTGFIKTENGYEPVGTQDDSKEVLYLIYLSENDEIKFVPIDFERFILEAEVADGLKITENHEIAIKISDEDEGFLVADANGLKTDGLRAFINDAAKVVSKDILVEESESGTNLTVQVDGKTIRKDLLYENGVAVLSSSIRISSITPSDTSLKAEYALVDADGNIIGEPIKVQKEGDLKEVKLGRIDDVIDPITGTIIEGSSSEKALVFVYVTSSGYQLVKAGLADYFTENIFADGLSTAGSVVSVKKAAGSEDYLQIDTAGVAIVGINSAISASTAASVAESKAYTDEKALALSGAVANEVARAVNAESELGSAIVDLRNYSDATFETKSSAESKIENAVANASAETLSQANAYADEKVADAVAEIDGVKVVDVVYDRDANSPKYIQLRLADGTLTDGFDASEFIKDEVLTSVELAGSNLVFIWNDDANTRTEIPLTAFSDVYTVGSGSTSFLKINGKDVDAIVDKSGGFANTLASTDFAEAKASAAKDEAILAANAYSDALSASVTTALNGVAEELSTLNGAEAVPGSVLHTVSDKFSRDLITGGLPITDITIEDAKSHSLLRVLNVNGEDRYFASSLATDMLYVLPNGTPVELNAYITTLEERVADLEEENASLKERVTDLENSYIDEQGVKDIIKSYLVGTDFEIKVTEENNGKLRVGFADNAIFGDFVSDSPQ